MGYERDNPQKVTGGSLQVVGVEITRPNDTTPYTAKDVIADNTAGLRVLTFDAMALAAGGAGTITKARLMTDKKDYTGRVRLHLYHTAPTAIADNSPFLLLYANKANRIGQIDFPACASEDSSNSTAASALITPGFGGLPLDFKCAAGDDALYGILEDLDGKTPAAQQKFYVELTAQAYR